MHRDGDSLLKYKGKKELNNKICLSAGTKVELSNPIVQTGNKICDEVIDEY